MGYVTHCSHYFPIRGIRYIIGLTNEEINRRVKDITPGELFKGQDMGLFRTVVWWWVGEEGNTG